MRRLSAPAAATLKLFLDDPSREWFGRDIIRLAGIPSGSLYPILHRFEGRSILASEWEDIDVAVAAGRRPRRTYRLDNSLYAQMLYDEWAAAQRSKAPAPKMRPAPGGAT